jgi:hypothetical protein
VTPYLYDESTSSVCANFLSLTFPLAAEDPTETELVSGVSNIPSSISMEHEKTNM